MINAALDRVGLAAASALLLAACGPQSAATFEVPEGTVLVIEDRPVSAAEIDRWLDTFRLIEPADTLPSLRRKIFSNLTLPLVVGELIDPTTRAATRAIAIQARAALEGAVTPEGVENITGSWKDLGLHAWGLALTSEPGVWSELQETVGMFYYLRVVELPEDPAMYSLVTIERVMFPYIDDMLPKDLIESGIDSMALTILDPEWEEIVPEHYKFRMRPPR
jgi:hypothetical protein